MQEYQNYSDLTGKALVASPVIHDARFMHAIILICTHNENGTLGIIINKKNLKLNSRALFNDLNIETTSRTPDFPVYIGGPVSPNSGFILHSADSHTTKNSLSISPNLFLSSNMDVMVALAGGRGPQKFILAMGYTGWHPGQLNHELHETGWVVTHIDHHFVFSETNEEEKWHKALAKTGVASGMFSSLQGHA